MKKLERLLTLTATLLGVPQPISADEIQRRVQGYPDGHAAFRRAFERDKDELRELGVPIVTVPLPEGEPGVDGYLIRNEDYYLADPGLDADELAAIGLAAQMVQFSGAETAEALWKLGGADGGAGGAALAAVPSDPTVIALFDAVRERRTVAFDYNGEGRRVEPWRLSHQRGRWYVAGFDRSRDAERNFRVDRIESELALSEPDSFVRPEGAGRQGDRQPWEFDETDEVLASVLVDAEQADWARTFVSPEAVAEQADGSVVLTVAVTNRDAFRSFVLGFSDKAEILEPEELRSDLIDWLTGVVA